MDILTQYDVVLYGIVMVALILCFAWLASIFERERDAEKTAALDAEMVAKTSAPLAQGWLVQFKSGGSRWLPCLAVSTNKDAPMIAYALFPTPAETENYRNSRIANEAARRKLIGDVGNAPASIFRIVKARLEFA